MKNCHEKLTDLTYQFIQKRHEMQKELIECIGECVIDGLTASDYCRILAAIERNLSLVNAICEVSLLGYISKIKGPLSFESRPENHEIIMKISDTLSISRLVKNSIQDFMMKTFEIQDEK